MLPSLDDTIDVTDATGQHTASAPSVVRTTIGPYSVDVVVDEVGRFVGVKDIQLETDFRTLQNRLSSIGTIDVDDLYRDE